MGKNKPDGKTKGKGSQLVIRIDKAEREAFVDLCEKLDTSAAREIRRFMRGFVAAHANRKADGGDAPAAARDMPVAKPAEHPVAEVEVLGSAALVQREPDPQTKLHPVEQPDA